MVSSIRIFILSSILSFLVFQYSFTFSLCSSLWSSVQVVFVHLLYFFLKTLKFFNFFLKTAQSEIYFYIIIISMRPFFTLVKQWTFVYRFLSKWSSILFATILALFRPGFGRMWLILHFLIVSESILFARVIPYYSSSSIFLANHFT